MSRGSSPSQVENSKESQGDVEEIKLKVFLQ
jgi:hypothetical protein